MSSPKGLDETIEDFFKGCTFKGKTVDTDEVSKKMIHTLTADFTKWESEWEASKAQVLTVARLSGRLAAAYAELDGGKTEIKWKHAKQGLQDGKEECRQTSRAKHCANADFESE